MGEVGDREALAARIATEIREARIGWIGTPQTITQISMDAEDLADRLLAEFDIRERGVLFPHPPDPPGVREVTELAEAVRGAPFPPPAVESSTTTNATGLPETAVGWPAKLREIGDNYEHLAREHPKYHGDALWDYQVLDLAALRIMATIIEGLTT